MYEDGGERSRHRQVSVEEILALHARVAGEIFEVDAQTWAIHGFIPVDGEVILAEFDHPQTARSVLSQLVENEERTAAATSVSSPGTVASAAAWRVSMSSQREPVTSVTSRTGTSGEAATEPGSDRRDDADRRFLEPRGHLLTAPEGRVLAFLDSPADAEAAIDDLVEMGFPKEEIFVLCGPKGAERLDVSGNRHGLRGRIYRLIEWLGDERDVLLRAGEHLSRGGLVLTVPVDERSKAAVALALAAHGGHEMAHFGRGHWERLGPD
jgi:hypothetical protein